MSDERKLELLDLIQCKSAQLAALLTTMSCCHPGDFGKTSYFNVLWLGIDLAEEIDKAARSIDLAWFGSRRHAH